MKMYAALLIDIKKSRTYSVKARNSVQHAINDAIQQMNTSFSSMLARKVEFSAGDEVQGLFNSTSAAFLYFRFLRMLLSPVELRAGIGFGEWNVKLEHAGTAAQDGPAYHHARHAIETVNETSDNSVLLYSGNQYDIYINAMINTPFMLTRRNSKHQSEMMLLLELLYPIGIQQMIDNKMDMQPVFVNEDNDNRCTVHHQSMLAGEIVFDRMQAKLLKPQPIKAVTAKDTFYISNGRIRGMVQRLSEIMDISRQSIDKTIKAGNIYEERNATIAAVRFMDEFYFGR